MNRRGFLVGLAAGPLAVAVGGRSQARLGATQLRLSPRERLSRLTPRERDVYEVWKKHPDWDDIRIGYEVKFPAAHIVRRYKRNIKWKLADVAAYDPYTPNEEP